MSDVKLLITDIESFDPIPFGKSGTLHYPIIVSEPKGNETMVAMISENILRRGGISESNLDSLVGSYLQLKDSTSLDGDVTPAEDRIADVLDGTYNFLLVSAANGRLVKSDVLKDELKRQDSEVRALVKVEQERERAAQKRKAAMERMLQRRLSNETPSIASSTKESTPADENQEEPVLEKNEDDIPF